MFLTFHSTQSRAEQNSEKDVGFHFGGCSQLILRGSDFSANVSSLKII